MRISDWSSDVCSSDLQATSYYIRVRSRRASGVAEPWSIVYPFRTPVNAAQVTTPAAVMVQPSIVVTPVPITSITRSEEHTSELQSLMRNSYAVFCWKKKKHQKTKKERKPNNQIIHHK